MGRIGIIGHGNNGLGMIAMIQALAIGVDANSIVNAVIPLGPYRPEHFYNEESDKSVQEKISAAETKRQRKNTKRLKNLNR